MDRTYKLIELVGTSKQGFSDAVAKAVNRAAETLQGLAWFEVIDQRGSIRHGHVEEYQVKVKVAFRILDGDPE